MIPQVNEKISEMQLETYRHRQAGNLSGGTCHLSLGQSVWQCTKMVESQFWNPIFKQLLKRAFGFSWFDGVTKFHFHFHLLKEINWEKHSEQFSWSQQPHSSPFPTKTRAKNLQIWLSFHLSKISSPFCPQETSANSLWQWRWSVSLQWFSWMSLAQAAAPWAKIGEEKRRKEHRLKWNVCENMRRTQPVFGIVYRDC